MKFYLTICLVVAQVTSGISQNLDIHLLREINIERNKSLDGSFKFITNSTSSVSLAIPISIMAVGLAEKDKTLFSKGLYIGTSWLCSTVISLSTKYIVNRKRPFVTYPDIEKITSGGSPSFPSGHTSEAFSTATSLSIAFPKWYIITPSFLWAGLVGYSRLDLGVHYPSDVLAGAIIGSGSAYLCYKVNKWLFRKKRQSSIEN